MHSMPSVVQTVIDPLQMLLTQAIEKVPSMLGALGLLLLGSFVGRWLRALLERLLALTMIDEHSEKIGINEVLFRLGIGRSLTTVLGFLVYWLIFLAFLLSSANVLQLSVVSDFLKQVVLFMPKVIAAVLILGGGLFLAQFLGEVVGRSAQANRIRASAPLSQATFWIMVVFSAVMALQRLGIDTSILSQSIQIVIAAAGLGWAIAFGLAFGHAGKPAAEDFMRRLTRKDAGSV